MKKIVNLSIYCHSFYLFFILVALVEFDPAFYTVHETDGGVDFKIVKQSQTFETVTVTFTTNEASVLDPATSTNLSVCLCLPCNSMFPLRQFRPL